MDPDEFENVDQSTQESLPVEDNSTEEININPAWQEALNQIPEEFHSVLTPKLSEWDKNFQDVQQKFAPYKDIVDNGIPMDRIQQAIQIADLLDTNPRGVYDFLDTTYNYGGQVAEKPGQNEEDEYQYDENNVDIENHPKFRELAQTVEQFKGIFEQQSQKEIESRVENQIQNEFSQISQKYGELDDQTKVDIARLAMGAGDNDLQKAAEDFFTRFRPPARVSDTAPPVMRGNGRVPNNQVSLDDIAGMNSEDRVRHVAKLLENAGRHNN